MNSKQFAMIVYRLAIEGNGLLRIGQVADEIASGLPALPTTGQGSVRIAPDSGYQTGISL